MLHAVAPLRITTRLFDSGQLFADRDVIKALVLGQVEMAAPGTWLVSAYVPDADMAQLPVFYGQPADVTHDVPDLGSVGSGVVEVAVGVASHGVVVGRFVTVVLRAAGVTVGDVGVSKPRLGP